MAQDANVPATLSDPSTTEASESALLPALRADIDVQPDLTHDALAQHQPTIHYQPTTIINHHQTAIINQQNFNVYQPLAPLVVTAPRGPSFIVRALWYLFVGWWLSAIVILLGYVCLLTVIGIPAAFALFNRIPQALTLRPRTTQYETTYRNGVLMLQEATIQQRPWIVRALYFLLIGRWFGAVWLVLAWVIGLLVITLPISFLMYNRTSGIMTLQRH